MDLYRNVMERLILTLGEMDEKLASALGHPSGLVVHEERLRVWPPWPWPPWGDDDDGKDEPEDSKKRAHRLAKSIVEFEKQIAKASLDLYAACSLAKEMLLILPVQRHPLSGSHCDLQPRIIQEC